MALSTKRRVFVEYYLRDFNATKAAKLAGYSERSADVIGHELLGIPEIRRAIDERLSELRMGTDEVLSRLAEQARGGAQYLIEVRDGVPIMNWERLQAEGKLHLIKKITFGADGRPQQVEFYDAQQALSLLSRTLGLFVDRSEVSGPGGGALQVRVVWENELDRDDQPT